VTDHSRYSDTKESFTFARSVSFSRIERRDPAILDCAEDVDHLRTVRHRRLILAAHVLDAKAHGRDFE